MLTIWTSRNAKLFQEENIEATYLAEQVKLMAWRWLRAKV